MRAFIFFIALFLSSLIVGTQSVKAQTYYCPKKAYCKAHEGCTVALGGNWEVITNPDSSSDMEGEYDFIWATNGGGGASCAYRAYFPGEGMRNLWIRSTIQLYEDHSQPNLWGVNPEYGPKNCASKNVMDCPLTKIKVNS